MPKFDKIGNSTQEEIDAKLEVCGMNQPRPSENGDQCSEGALEKEEAYLLMVIFSFLFLSALVRILAVDNRSIKDPLTF